MKYRSLITAILQTSALFVAGIVIPVAGQLAALFAPIPLVLVYLRSGRAQGFIALAASCLLVGLLGGWESAAILFFTFGLMAIGIAEGMRRQWKPEEVSLFGGLLPVAVAAAAIAAYFLRVHKSPVSAVEEYLQSSMVEAAKI